MTIELPLAGKVAFVTGGSRGIGAATVRALANAGAKVAFTYMNSSEQATKLVAEVNAAAGTALAIQADSADVEAVNNAIDATATEFGQFDILVNNAGILHAGPFSEMMPADFDRLIAVHARAPYFAAQAAVRKMVSGGRIITIGTNLSVRASGPNQSLYIASKSGLIGMTKALARELGPLGITVNTVDPGSTDTDMNPANGPNAPGQLAFNALGRYGAASDIAAAVVFLAGPGGRSITGSSILVDSGHNA